MTKPVQQRNTSSGRLGWLLGRLGYLFENDPFPESKLRTLTEVDIELVANRVMAKLDQRIEERGASAFKSARVEAEFVEALKQAHRAGVR